MAENGYSNGNNGITNGGTWGKVFTLQQRAFVDRLFECNFNATEAARQAGYQGDDRTLAVTGSRLLRNAKVLEEIRQRWSGCGVTSEEIIARLADQMRADISDFFEVPAGGRVAILDLEQAAQRGKLHLIKKLYWTQFGPRLELHDAQRAAELLAKLLLIVEGKAAESGLTVILDI